MRRGRGEWVRVIRQFERSRLTQAAFAEEHGIAVGTLRSWIYRLRREEADSAPILPVRVIASTAPTARRSEAPAEPIEVKIGERIRLRFGAMTEPAVVADVVALLAERC